jgi:hypothetical protein
MVTLRPMGTKVQTDMTNLSVAFRNFAKALEMPSSNT